MSPHEFFDVLSLGWFYSSHIVFSVFIMEVIIVLATAIIRFKYKPPNVIFNIATASSLLGTLGIGLFCYFTEHPFLIISSFHKDVHSLNNLTPSGLFFVHNYLWWNAIIVLFLGFSTIFYLLILISLQKKTKATQAIENEKLNTPSNTSLGSGGFVQNMLSVLMLAYAAMMLYLIFVITPFSNFRRDHSAYIHNGPRVPICKDHEEIELQEAVWMPNTENANFKHLPIRLVLEYLDQKPGHTLHQLDFSLGDMPIQKVSTTVETNASPIDVLIVPLFPSTMTELEKNYALMILYMFLDGCQKSSDCKELSNLSDIAEPISGFNFTGNEYSDRLFVWDKQRNKKEGQQNQPFYSPYEAVNALLYSTPIVDKDLEEIPNFVKEHIRTPAKGQQSPAPFLIIFWSWNSELIENRIRKSTAEINANILFIDLISQGSKRMTHTEQDDDNSNYIAIELPPSAEQYLTSNKLNYNLEWILPRFKRQQVMNVIASMRSIYSVDLSKLNIYPPYTNYPQLFIGKKSIESIYYKIPGSTCVHELKLDEVITSRQTSERTGSFSIIFSSAGFLLLSTFFMLFPAIVLIIMPTALVIASIQSIIKEQEEE